MLVKIDVTEDVQRIRAVVAAIDTAKQISLESIAKQLRTSIDDSYEQKSQGKRGADGITWKPRKNRQLPIGIRSGYLRSTLKVTVEKTATSERIKATYDHPFANAFSVHRPLLPQSLPRTWLRDADAALQPIVRTAESILNSGN